MLRIAISCTVFALWWIALAIGLKAITLDAGELPIDYRTYVEAADRLALTGSPYPDAEIAQEAWRQMHRAAVAIFRTDLAPDTTAQPVSGPYLYPPALAQLIHQTQLPPLGYLIALTGVTVALCLGWLALAGTRSLLWLLPMAVSIDVIAAFLGGNIEIFLIALSMLACWLLWRKRAVLAAVPIAVVLVVKPQFGLLFVAFAVIGCVAARPGCNFGRSVLVAACASVALVLSEALRWPTAAREDFLAYVADPVVFQYFALPADVRWPMLLWNRAPLQVFLNAGLSFEVAQALSLALYVLLLLVAAALLRGRRLRFAEIFALAYTLLWIARPITWSMPLLAVFVLAAVWPACERRERIALATVAAAVGLTHWVAFVLFPLGVWPGLLTLQTPAFPWETLLILPGSWAVVVIAARRGRRPGPEDEARSGS